MKSCSVPNCADKYYAKGLCGKHYTRQKKGQSLTELSVYQLTDLERLQQKYSVSESGCWEWNFPGPNGRANTFLFDGKVQNAYRASWKIHNGPIPDNLCVLHKCDNGLCVNPEHLFLGTNLDNYNDMISKNRGNVAKGEQKVKCAKLKEYQVIEIRSSNLHFTELAKKYGVHRQTIQDILSGKQWKHLLPAKL